MENMATITNEETLKPRAWVGCLACYNAGKLVGEWVDAVYANDITPQDLHGDKALAESHEELWVMDHENIPVRHEMNPSTATAWGEVFAEVREYQWEALCAWVESGYYVAEHDGAIPSISDFGDRYCGEWMSFQEYAENRVEEYGLLNDVPDEVARYFDYEGWARDLKFDYFTHEKDNGNVFIFRAY